MGAAFGLMLAGPLQAKRDPAYAAARAAGHIGEQVDGYLGIVAQPTPELQRIVDDINIKRRAVYAQKAQENNATVEEYALSVGCQAIARTVPGEKYQAPDRSWKTRTAAPPERDPRCP
ncbi:MAG: YdbL family protein [Pseudomonadota bacterium]